MSSAVAPGSSSPDAAPPPAGLPAREIWARLSPLLDELLELEPDERAARLERVATEDAAIAESLRRLLAEHDAAGARGFLGGVAPVPVDSQARGLAGTVVGAYTLGEPLGQGGSGSVWRARRSDGHFEGVAAVKLLHLSLLGHSAAERFRREGAILARLTHPHIARLLDTGITGGGQPYLVIEFVDGAPIDVHCAQQRLGIEARLRLFGEVLAAVAHAHRHLVVHRDIKPGNVLVTHDGRVKLLDFGIAKLLQGDSAEGLATALTREGGQPLTPAFAAPEQFEGGEVSTATDIYSLGVLLYHLLAGRHPTGATGSGTAPARAVLNVDPPRMSRAVTLDPARVEGVAQPSGDVLAAERASTVPRLRRRLAGDLDTIVARMLRKLPGERYPSVDAVAEDIRRHLAHEPISVRPDGWGYVALKFARRHRGAVLATGLTVLAIGAGVVGTVSQAQRAAEQSRIAQTQRDHALHALGRAEASNEFVVALLRESWNRPRSTDELLTGAEQLLERQFDGQPDLRARLQAMVIDLHIEMNEGRRAEALGRRAEASARAAGDPVSLAVVQCAQAVARLDALDFQGARRLFTSALAVLRPRRDTELAALLNCLAGYSQVESLQGGDPQASLALADEALALLPAGRGSLRSLRHYARTAKADALNALGRTAEALPIYEEMRAEVVALGLDRSVLEATRLVKLSYMLRRAGQPLLASGAQAQADAINAELRADGELPAVDLSNQGQLLGQLGDIAGAHARFDRALAKARRDNDPALVGVVSLYDAALSCDAGPLARCAERVATARERLEPLLSPDHPRRASLRVAEAQLAEARGQLPAARAALVEVQTLLATRRANPALRQAVGWRLARLDLRMGQLEAARRGADAAVTEARALLAGFSHSLPLGQALLLRGQVHAAQGEMADARRVLAEAIDQLRRSAGDAAPSLHEAQAAMAALGGAQRVP